MENPLSTLASQVAETASNKHWQFTHQVASVFVAVIAMPILGYMLVQFYEQQQEDAELLRSISQRQTEIVIPKIQSFDARLRRLEYYAIKQEYPEPERTENQYDVPIFSNRAAQ